MYDWCSTNSFLEDTHPLIQYIVGMYLPRHCPIFLTYPWLRKNQYSNFRFGNTVPEQLGTYYGRLRSMYWATGKYPDIIQSQQITTVDNNGIQCFISALHHQ
jgi:hypothetical protein